MAKLNFNDAIQEKAQEYLASKDGDKKTVETKNTETKLSPLRKSLREMDFSNKDADGSFQIGGMFGNESVSENIKKTEEQIKNNPNYNEETGKFGGEVSVGGKTVAQNEAPKIKGSTAEEEFDAGYFKEGGKSADTLMSEWLQAGKNGGQALAELEKLYAKNGQPVSDKAYEAFIKYFKSDLDAIKNAGLSDYFERNKDKSKTDDIDSLKGRALKETSEMGTYLDKALEGMSDKAKERYDKLAKTARGLIDGVNEDYAENLPKGYYGEYKNLKDYYLNHGYEESDAKKKAGAQIGYFILDGLGTSLMNASAVIKGGDTSQQSQLQQIQQERLKGALERYNKKRDEAMSSEIDLFKKYAGDNAELTSKWESLMMDSYYRTLVTQIDAEKRILMYKILAKYADDLSMNDIVKLAKIAVADSAENGSALESVFSLGEKAVDAIK